MIRIPKEEILFIVTVVIISSFVNLLECSGQAARKSAPQKKNEPKSWSARQMEQIEKSIVHYTNRERVKKGLKPLQPSDALKYTAGKHTEHMCEAQLLAHEDEAFPQEWRTLSQRLKIANVRAGAENVAYRTIEAKGDTWAEEVVKGWMKSPPHRKNILDKSQKYIGVTVLPCKNEIGYTTQVFSPNPGSMP
ncbi:CAP domain-containing protein [Desulfomonile tiedjei]|uniref:Cysteine-rich secretory protein family n=1 Tax=Desulfomonile tiedjei (strain ATCC 49306 / DSM 6799 / DCB-1) TaxID=706587 RepID=I4CDL0_DESTA|nr:CAP domain-containing protein [Desulfomonile tiedjei]AFM27651.1 Cysteine-rich secretory protein family [Desulfomonile tiedjei DSM 6799]